jgi:hypothetical protein
MWMSLSARDRQRGEWLNAFAGMIYCAGRVNVCYR